MVEANVKIITELKLFLETVVKEPEIRQLFTNGSADFSRNRKMPLDKLAMLLVNLPKRSLSIELQGFFDSIGQGGSKCTKGAFCLQRVKLKPIFFSIWNKWLLNNFYHHYGDSVKKWDGFRLVAVDGSTSYLFDKGDIKNHFGTQDNQHVQVPMARVMQAHDVLNDLTIWGGIFPITQSEQQIISDNVEHLPEDSLTLFDRGYPSYTLMYLLLNLERARHFVMRCRSNFSNVVKDFLSSGKHSKIVELTPNKEAQQQLYKLGYKVTDQTRIRVRLVKINLPTGEQEVLITSLCNEKVYSLNALKKLYALRWRIETTYAKQKNQQQMEIYTGHKVISIEQDYAATLFVANLQSLIEKQTENYIKTVSKRRRYDYKVNRNISWAAMKDKIASLFLQNDSYTILSNLEAAFKQNLEPVRPGRTFARVRKAKRLNGKYQTYTNYRRSI